MAEVFKCRLNWTGATHGPTQDYGTFSRDLEVRLENGFTIPMSAAQSYKGDATRTNPEQLMVAALSACQALTYLALAARNGVSVIGYSDDADGRLALVESKIRMSQVTLRPRIALTLGSDEARARDLVTKAHEQCFISNSVTTKVTVEASFEVR